MEIINGLTPKQREVLDQIALSNDAGHGSRIIQLLIDKGLVVEYEEKALFGKFPMTIKRYKVPVDVHVCWASLASPFVDGKCVDCDQLEAASHLSGCLYVEVANA